MTSDLQALLAAIVADPSDDVARLAYADCLQENGNSARAEFIRLQVEAERHHPDSHTRDELERQAYALFERHWIDWWGEVCAAVGFPIPAPKPGGRLGRFASRVGLRPTAGKPYHRIGFWLGWNYESRITEPLNGLSAVSFRRGFPDDVELSYGQADFLPAWPTVSPLHHLTFTAPYPETWPDGPHLAGVRDLALQDYDPLVLLTVLQSPHFDNLDSLNLEIPGYYNDEDPTSQFADELARVLSAPRARQLKRLAIPVWNDRAAEVVANAENLRGLESLEVSVIDERDEDREGAGRRLAILARSPHLAGLKELTVHGGLDANGLAAAIQNPTWTGLRKLDLDLWYNYNRLDSLLAPDGLPLLEEFRLGGIHLDVLGVVALAHSPLVARVRHLALRCQLANHAAAVGLADVGDPKQLETFSVVFAPNDFPSANDLAPLRERYGDKLRVPPT